MCSVSFLPAELKPTEEEDGASVRCGGGGVRKESGSTVSGRLSLSSVSGDFYGAGDSALHTHLLQGNTNTWGQGCFLSSVSSALFPLFPQDCFLESVDKATLCCPLCRKRVSTWARLNSRNKTLVNQQLWTQIQISFPLQCQRRLSGQDTVAEDDPGGTDTP